ncbi:MAG: amidohydrolase family protein [Verrucomicrobiales bacterium]
MPEIPQSKRGPVDMHVHMIGNGLSGSGCWSRLNSYRKFCARYLLRGIGFDVALEADDFDDQYAAFLAWLVRESSLGHAVVLAHEEVYHESGGKMDFGSFHTSNDWVLEASRRHPELLAAVSIHPARPDAIDELHRCAEAGAVMMKLLPPSQNVDCSLPAYRAFWETMAKLRMPFLSHTGGEYTVPVVSRRLFTPEMLRLPLECGVNVIAAHAGTRSGPPGFEKNHVSTFLRMAEEFPNLFADTSALNTPNRSHGLKTCLRPEVQPRIVHGSDFPVPVGAMWPRLRGLVTGEQARHASAIGNVLERDYRLKLDMGFQPEVFTRIWEILRVSGSTNE